MIVSHPGPAEVLVWTAPRSVPGDSPRDPWLDATERARAAAMPSRDRDTFVVARTVLRGALGALLGCDPARVPLAAACACGRPHGRVRVVAVGSDPGAALHVSITRSGPRVAVAVAAAPVGLDLTSVEAVARAPLATVALGPAEAASWARDDGDRGYALARAWARKEAALKAVGTGLGVEPSLVDVRSRMAAVPDGERTHVVRLADLPRHGDEVGAVALLATEPTATEVALHVEVRDGAPFLRDP